MNRNDYHLLETAKDYDDFWTNWELEDVPITDFQSGDILVQVFKPDIPREAVVFLNPDCDVPAGHFRCVPCESLKSITITPSERTYPCGEQSTYKRVKESALFYKENITDQLDHPFYPLKRGDLMEMRLGNGKWCLALFLGLEEDWLEKSEGATWSIHLCNKTIREALGNQFGSCRRLIDIDYESNIIRVRQHRWVGDKELRTADLLNGQGRCYDVRWRKK